MKYASLLCALIIVFPAIASAQKGGGVSRGTINVILANQNGIVALTDSMVTADGHQLPDRPYQKLYKLDDRTVCTIAGFLAAPGPADIYIDASAMIREYTKQLGGRPPQNVLEKLTSLAFLFRFDLSSIASLRAGTGSPTVLSNYKSEITVAGYDTDGVVRVGQITLDVASMGPSFEVTMSQDPIKEVSKSLVPTLAGIRYIADRLLADPGTVNGDAALADYAASIRKDHGASLTIEQMKALANQLAAYTALRESGVGGENQIAVLQDGRLISVQQPKFPEAPTPPLVLFNIIVDSVFGNPHYDKESWPSSGGVVYVPKGTPIPLLFLRTTFNHTFQTLDGNYFFGSTFNDCVLTYHGGRPFYFDKSNRVQGTSLIVQGAKPDDPHVQELIHSFQWASSQWVPNKP